MLKHGRMLWDRQRNKMGGVSRTTTTGKRAISGKAAIETPVRELQEVSTAA